MCEFLQIATNLWRENCCLNKKLDQANKQLTQAGKTDLHQQYSESLLLSSVNYFLLIRSFIVICELCSSLYLLVSELLILYKIYATRNIGPYVKNAVTSTSISQFLPRDAMHPRY